MYFSTDPRFGPIRSLPWVQTLLCIVCVLLLVLNGFSLQRNLDGLNAAKDRQAQADQVAAKLDYLNLRGAKLTDVLITDCIINELDLGSAAATRVALKGCTIGALDLTGAKLKDFDLRGADFRSVSGIGNMAGVVMDEYQLGLLAPLLAAHLGITVI